jgi:hypothetical protein
MHFIISHLYVILMTLKITGSIIGLGIFVRLVSKIDAHK